MPADLPHATRNDLGKKVRARSVELLIARLADAIDLHSQAKQAHWNVKGPNFIALHELFDKVADDLRDHADDLAERAVQLGAHVHGTVRAAAEASSLKEYPLEITSSADHVVALATALAQFARLVRESIEKADQFGDPGTADLFTQISRAVDKSLWLVESHARDDR